MIKTPKHSVVLCGVLLLLVACTLPETPTAPPFVTPSATNLPTAVTSTAPPATETPTETPTETATLAPSDTPAPTDTATPTETDIPSPTPSSTPIDTPAPTDTPPPTETLEPSPTITLSPSPKPTRTGPPPIETPGPYEPGTATALPSPSPTPTMVIPPPIETPDPYETNPAPIPTPTPTPPPIPEPPPCDAGADVSKEGWTYTPFYFKNLRTAPRVADDTLAGYQLPGGTTVPVTCIYHPNDTDRWARVAVGEGSEYWVIVAGDFSDKGMGYLYGDLRAPDSGLLSASKLGSHIDRYPDDAWLIRENGGRVVSITDRNLSGVWGVYQQGMTVAVRAESEFPAGTNFLRLFDDLNTSDPVELAHKWADTMRPIIHSAPPDVYWLAVNEPPTDIETLQKLAAFETERVKIANAEGWHCALFSFSTGMPDLSRWQYLYPALEAANTGDHVIVLNEYFPALPWIWWGMNQSDEIADNAVLHWPDGYAESWLFGRYRKVWRQHIEPNGWTHIRFVLGETGSDRVATTSIVGEYLSREAGPWRKMETPWLRTGVWQGSLNSTYLALLGWADRQLQQDPYVLGAAIFTHSDFSEDWYNKAWGKYGITGDFAQTLYTYIRQQRPPISPSPTTPPIITPTHIPSPPEDNRFINSGLEGGSRPVIFNEINVIYGWEPFYCDQPYTPEKCPAPRQGSGNPIGLEMGRPEFKPVAFIPGPYEGGNAQQWFCYYRTCWAGVYQTIATHPGETCTVGAHIREWWNIDDDPESDVITEDDRAGSAWQIIVDVTGGNFAFEESNLYSPLQDIPEDQWVKIQYEFTAQGYGATVFFANLRRWPIANNDNYLDNAFAYCQ